MPDQNFNEIINDHISDFLGAQSFDGLGSNRGDQDGFLNMMQSILNNDAGLLQLNDAVRHSTEDLLDYNNDLDQLISLSLESHDGHPGAALRKKADLRKQRKF